MDISEDQMREIVKYYFDSKWFGPYENAEKVKVKRVRQRSNGRFVIDFDGKEPARHGSDTPTDVQ